MAVIIDDAGFASVLTGVNGEDDSISGLDLNDTLVATTGNDTLNGGTGDDVADYSSLGVGIALLTQGQIAKDFDFSMGGDTVTGFSGTDIIEDIEEIIGDPTQTNIINGVASGSFGTNGNNATFNVDLENNSFIITPFTTNTFFPAPITFAISNFNDVRGTNRDDVIIGDDSANILRGADGNDEIEGRGGRDLLDGGDGDDTLFGNKGLDTILGSSGNDSIDGGGGRDTLDYSDFKGDVTLKSVGEIDKFADMGGMFIFDGTDTIGSIETIVGNASFINVIDGTDGAAGNGSFVIDLAANSLVVNIDTTTPGVPPSISFEVFNFVDVVGTVNDDVITGDDQDNFIFGSGGDDTIQGGTGSDTANYEALGGISLTTFGDIEKFDSYGNFIGTDVTDSFETFVSGQSAIEFEAFTGDFGGFVDGLNEEGAQISVNLNTQTLQVVVFDSSVPVITTKIEGFQGARGTINNDIFVGDMQDNYFIGSFGNDTYNGEYDAYMPTSINTVSYEQGIPNGSIENEIVGITLLSQGQIAKTSSDGTDLGTDLIQNIQQIVGDSRAVNVIDGVSDGAFLDNGDNASFNVNLLNDELIVTPITTNSFFPSAVTFAVLNFDNVFGTNNDDTIIANDDANVVIGFDGDDFIEGRAGRDLLDGGDGDDSVFGNKGFDTIQGSLGSDFIDGGGGKDTLDYSGSGLQVILGGSGEIQKTPSFGSITFDTINSIETIIGDENESNTISGLLNAAGKGSFDISLKNNSLIINIDTTTPGVPPTISFEVFNFNNVVGTVNDDIITGGNGGQVLNGEDGNDVINGFGSNDWLFGGNGDDIVNGGNGSDFVVGVGDDLGADDFDVLSGGKKSDTFVLGNEWDAFYIGIGRAEITDFESGTDTIQLNGVAGDYTFTDTTISLGGDLIATTNAAFDISDLSFISFGPV